MGEQAGREGGRKAAMDPNTAVWKILDAQYELLSGLVGDEEACGGAKQVAGQILGGLEAIGRIMVQELVKAGGIDAIATGLAEELELGPFQSAEIDGGDGLRRVAIGDAKAAGLAELLKDVDQDADAFNVLAGRKCQITLTDAAREAARAAGKARP